jgi:hypothetical protein
MPSVNPERQILDPARSLDLEVNLKSAHYLKTDAWTNCSMLWSDNAISYLNNHDNVLHRKRLKREAEAVAYFCMRLRKANSVKILAPLHDFTHGGATKTLPHITISIRTNATSSKETFHATYETLVPHKKLNLQWLTREVKGKILYYGATVVQDVSTFTR